jgi:myo-inositol catabolism protein IolC
MIGDLGYTKPLFILAFDHRGSFSKNLYNVAPDQLTQENIAQIKEYKQIIYEGFKHAVTMGVPKDQAAVLVDEEFGEAILADAKVQGFATIVSVERSGQDIFTFEYGDEYGEHLEKYRPTFAKALIRYNPEDSDDKKQGQQANLKILSEYAHQHTYKFLLEPLVPPSESQLAKVNGVQDEYDKIVRPGLTVTSIKELQEAGIEPDVWKLEGMDSKEDYEKVITQIRSGGRANVGMVLLGRGTNEDKVEEWLSIGAGVEGVIGFAVGRVIFWNAIVAYHDGKMSKEQAVEEISKKFQHVSTVFTQVKA